MKGAPHIVGKGPFRGRALPDGRSSLGEEPLPAPAYGGDKAGRITGPDLQQRWVAVPGSVVEDPDLSFEALGVYYWLIAESAHGIVHVCGQGGAEVEQGLGELIRRGYITASMHGPVRELRWAEAGGDA